MDHLAAKKFVRTVIRPASPCVKSVWMLTYRSAQHHMATAYRPLLGPDESGQSLPWLQEMRWHR